MDASETVSINADEGKLMLLLFESVHNKELVEDFERETLEKENETQSL